MRRSDITTAAGIVLVAGLVLSPLPYANADDKPGQEVCQPQDAHIQVGADVWAIDVPAGTTLTGYCVKYGTTVEYVTGLNVVGPTTVSVERDKDISHGVLFTTTSTTSTTVATTTATTTSAPTTAPTSTAPPDQSTTVGVGTPPDDSTATGPPTTLGQTAPPPPSIPPTLPNTGWNWPMLALGSVVAAIGLTMVRITRRRDDGT